MIVKAFLTRADAEAFAASVDAALGYPKRGRFQDGRLAPPGVGETLRHDCVYRSCVKSISATTGEETYVFSDEWLYPVEGEVAVVRDANTSTRTVSLATAVDDVASPLVQQQEEAVK